MVRFRVILTLLGKLLALSVVFTQLATPALSFVGSPPHARPEPEFKRVLVFPGLALNFVQFFGILTGLREMNWTPDLIIGSCGGGMAAMIAQAFPDSFSLKKFVESEDFFSLMAEGRIDSRSMGTVLTARLGHILLDEKRFDSHKRLNFPSLFSHTLLDVPFKPLSVQDFYVPFGADPFRIVVLGSRILFSPQEQNKPRNRHDLFQEVYFTDSVTAQAIGNFYSPVAQSFPRSTVAAQTDVITGVPVAVAVRGGVADPYFMSPQTIEGKSYITGAIDLHPLELAQRLGREVVSIFPGGANALEVATVKSVFGYDPRQRIRQISAYNIDHWVDLTANDIVQKKYNLNPRPGLSTSPPRLLVRSGLPDRFGTEFKAKVEGQWKMGYDRAIEALKQPAFSKAHIRVMNPVNTTAATRHLWGRR